MCYEIDFDLILSIHLPCAKQETDKAKYSAGLSLHRIYLICKTNIHFKNLRIMKKLFILAAVALMSLGVNAQENVKFDVHAGINMSSISVNDNGMELWDMEDGDTKMNVGFNVGVGVTFPVNDMFSLKSGLDFTMKGGKIEESYAEDDMSYEDTYTAKAYYLQIPVLASFGFNASDNLRIEANVGPYLAFGVGGKVTNDYYGTYQGEHDSFSEDFDLFGDKGWYVGEDEEPGDAGMKRLDVGLKFGADVIFSERYKVGLSYDLGLTNIMDKKIWSDEGVEGSLKTRNLSISVGYIF